MTSARPLSQAKLFRFTVPGLGPTLAIPIEQLIGVARLPFVTEVPCTPPAILGLSRWQDTPVTLVDLGRLLDETAPDNGQDFSAMRHLVFKIADQGQIVLAGCPILTGSQMISVPLRLPRADVPAGINPALIHQAVSIDGAPVLLLDTTHLSDLFVSLQSVL